MLPKVVFQFAKPIAEDYNDLHLMHDEHFTLRFEEVIDPYSVAYQVTHRADRFDKFSFVGWFIDNFFAIPPDRIEITPSEDDDRMFLSFHLIFDDDSSVNKSIVFIYG